ncbi:hypothetical protein ACRBEV_32665 (plasmid) [Methylobacterium phyllosphaerae]
MSELHKLLDAGWIRPTDELKPEPSPWTETSTGSPLKAVTAMCELAQAPTQRSPPQKWDALIQRVHAAARQSREAEAQAREQEARIGQILEEVREDINSANERARLAEAKARDVQIRAEVQIRAAEDRAKVAEAHAQSAEDRAQHGEQWLVRVQETILSEFTDLTDQAAA